MLICLDCKKIFIFVSQCVRQCCTVCKTAEKRLYFCLTNCATKRWCVKQVYPVFLQELRFIFPANVIGAGRLHRSRVIFLRQWMSKKQSSETEHCFPLTHPLRKITKPLSSPWRFLMIFSGANVGKSNPLSEAAFHTSTPLKNRRNSGGDDRQVSQNGMPFCTGCTLFGHILNLPEGLRPLGTPS